MKWSQFLPLFVLSFLFFSCKQQENVVLDEKETTLFTLVDNDHTQINFENKVTENVYFNFLNYSYIYNGGGVAVGDINNDGLEDIYFTSNQGKNKLYLNQGNLKFKDITAEAKVEDEEGWTTGVTFVDINADGWLDIYVSKSGSLNNHEHRKNKLFINQKDNTFIEKAAKYGIDHYGFTTQAYFFDYDLDGDIDLYLVNHRQDFENNTNINPQIQQNIQPYSSDQLFRNDKGYFTNVTQEAGVANNAWGLSAAIGDFNGDTLPDIYVANDFLQPDYLYINQADGTFKDNTLKHFNHISSNSMGSDYADINNDFQPDLIVLDMLAEDYGRAKQNMATMSTDNFNKLVQMGYHYQYMSNMLQLNNSNGTFSEIGQLAGISKTDWSWAPLVADFNNDGFNDIFITNGIEHDLSNQDFRNQMRDNIMKRKKVTLEKAISMMPSTKLSNYIFKNNRDLTFSNTTKKWGLDHKVNSNGAVYSDLDNDGDLDLIINNQAEQASIYRNNSKNNSCTIILNGPKLNTKGIGSKIYVFTDSLKQFKELQVSRGFQSSVSHRVHFGLGKSTKIDSIKIIWPDGRIQLKRNSKINTEIVLSYNNATKSAKKIKAEKQLFKNVNAKKLGINYLQKENLFDDFKLQLLLPQKLSENSNPLAIADVNGDGLDDLFIGNAKGARASLFYQKPDGTFKESNISLFELDKEYEDTDALFVDVDNDKDLDLFVSSGGYDVTSNNKLLQDRLYLNDGKGNYSKTNSLPEMLSHTKRISAADYDNDGDIDLFLSGGVTAGKYPLADRSYLIQNEGGNFTDVTKQKIGEIKNYHLINDVVFSDFDTDGDFDLIMVGEWMPITIFKNDNNKFVHLDIPELKNSSGWYQSIRESDIDQDGKPDYLIGNWGENNKFHPTKEKPLHIYANYFDNNNSFDMILSKVSKDGSLLPVRGKQCSSEQNPFLANKLKTFKQFATATLPEIYGQKNLDKAVHFKASNFKSLILKNMGKGRFSIKNMPIQAQFGPTLDLLTHDFNGDGYMDIFGVGNRYDAEVETVRYDASKGYILLGDRKGNFKFTNDTSYFNNSEAKAIRKITIKGLVHFIILNKNGPLKILKLNQN